MDQRRAKARGTSVQRAAQRLPSPGEQGPARLILVADDYDAAAEMLADVISLDGHAALVALDGREALQLALANEIDAAILDLDMPLANGNVVAEQIRRARPGCCPLLIALTGGDNLGETAGEGLFDLLLTKPIARGDLHGVYGILNRRSRPPTCDVG